MTCGAPEPGGIESLTLGVDVDAPARARRFLTEHTPVLSPQVLDDALLLVTELVTNAVHHGRPEITLQLRTDPPCLGVEVHDGGEQLPVLPAARPDIAQPSGRGLLIVDALADRWGISRSNSTPGKTVWFELRDS